MFDKAEEAASLETLRARRDGAAGEIKSGEEELKSCEEPQRGALEARLRRLRFQAESLTRLIEERERQAAQQD